MKIKSCKPIVTPLIEGLAVGYGISPMAISMFDTFLYQLLVLGVRIPVLLGSGNHLLVTIFTMVTWFIDKTEQEYVASGLKCGNILDYSLYQF